MSSASIELTAYTAATPTELPSSSGEVTRSWVHFFPAGKVFTRDNRTFDIDDMGAIIERSIPVDGVDLAIDYDHQSEFIEKNGQKAIAAGWIRDFTVRDNGIWALIEWTKAAAQHLMAREYRYNSPTFLADKKTGRVWKITGGGLTNSPAFAMTAIASKQSKGTKMEVPASILQALGLQSGASVADALEAISQLQNSQRQVASNNQAINDAMLELAGERAALRNERLSQKVDHAISKGVFTPAMKEWASEYIRENEEGFDQFVSRMGAPFGHLLQGTPQREAHEASFKKKPWASAETTSVRNEIAAQLGLSQKDLES